MPSRHDDGGLRLTAVGLQCRRGGRTLLHDVSFDVTAGQVLELRGGNGSGKTTLIRSLAGLTPFAAGSVQWMGQAIVRGDTAYAQQMAYLGHQNALNAELTARENLTFFLRLGGALRQDALLALQAWDVAHLADQPVRRLSQGQRRRVALARVWAAQRSLWLLDEPCAALDDAGMRLLDLRLTEHTAHGGMAIVATHRPLGIEAEICRTLLLGASKGAMPQTDRGRPC